MSWVGSAEQDRHCRDKGVIALIRKDLETLKSRNFSFVFCQLLFA